MPTPREIVRRGYDMIGANYLNARPTSSPDVALLADVFSCVAAGARVLDAGCGAGMPITAALDDARATTVGVDCSIGQLRLLGTRVPRAAAVEADLAQLPFADNTFAAVVSYYAIIHVPRDDHARVFREIHRVLVGNGVALLCLGARDNPGDEDLESWLGAPMFWSHYDAATNTRLLQVSGFEIIWDRVLEDPMSHGVQQFVFLRRP